MAGFILNRITVALDETLLSLYDTFLYKDCVIAMYVLFWNSIALQYFPKLMVYVHNQMCF